VPDRITSAEEEIREERERDPMNEHCAWWDELDGDDMEGLRSRPWA
jgi:hypothetical protein